MRYVPPPPLASLPTLDQIEISCMPKVCNEIARIRDKILAAYVCYEAARPDGLHLLVPIRLTSRQREILDLIFKRRYGCFKNLWHGLNDHFDGTGESTCPYCNFGEQWEHDHYLPKSVFPEFTLYPMNLIPICKVCNGKKLARYAKNGDRIFSHLFSELKDVVDVLYAQIEYTPRLSILFNLKKPSALNATQFNVLKLHFEKLDLADRYSRQASTVLAKLVRQFRTAESLSLGRTALRHRLNQMALDRVASSSPNHWEAVMMKTLAASDDFTDHIFA